MIQLQFSNVEKRYDNNVAVVSEFSLTVDQGQFVSFLGPSGCGKTTTLRMIAGLENNTSGTIEIAGHVVSDPLKNILIPPEKRNVGMVFQSYAVWPHMSVFENVAYPLKFQKKTKDQIKSEVMKSLEMVELNGFETRKPNQLSGGQQQRVALARGLVMNPRILLLDEPLSNLDAKLREKMRKDIRQIQQRLNLTVVYVTHDQKEAFQMSDKVVVMNQGKIEQVGTPSEIQNSPATAFVRSFVEHEHYCSL